MGGLIRDLQAKTNKLWALRSRAHQLGTTHRELEAQEEKALAKKRRLQGEVHDLQSDSVKLLENLQRVTAERDLSRWEVENVRASLRTLERRIAELQEEFDLRCDALGRVCLDAEWPPLPD